MPILTDDMKRVVREQSLGFFATVCAEEVMAFFDRERQLARSRARTSS